MCWGIGETGRATALTTKTGIVGFEVCANQLDEMQKATQLAVQKAIKAETRATAAFIVAGGAILAAMAAALIPFLALRRLARASSPQWF
jgi:hypothetical protein